MTPAWGSLSPSTVGLDRTRTLQIHAAHGVSHAWLVDPVLRTLDVLRRGDDRRWTLLVTSTSYFAKIVLQSSFILTTVQPFAWASSSPLSSRPTWDSRSYAHSRWASVWRT